jgi:hypothetical protein
MSVLLVDPGFLKLISNFIVILNLPPAGIPKELKDIIFLVTGDIKPLDSLILRFEPIRLAPHELPCPFFYFDDAFFE